MQTITAVKEIARHRYDGQCETAILAKVNGSKRYRWYVGYGGDYMPATRDEVANLETLDPRYDPQRPEDYVDLVI